MKSYISTWPQAAPDLPFPRTLAVLGCTGSIGVSALDVVGQHPELFRVAALAGGRNARRLAGQAARFRPALLAVLDDGVADELRTLLPAGYAPEIVTGPEGYTAAATLPEATLVLSAIVGAAGFLPTLAAAQAGKRIALANKESLVLGGSLIREACRKSGAVVLPVDSEHNALFQALCGHADAEGKELSRLILTASGGPFRGRDAAFLAAVTPEQAMSHPNWSMGAKISVDSASLMNKGLEVIEACHLYGLPVQRVDVLVHPQSIVHSLAEYVDGSQLAHLGVPDMRIPIAHCLCFPRRVTLDMPRLDLAQVGGLTFERADEALFPCLRLAKEAYAASPSHPAVLNAANEAAVDLFLTGAIGFMDIPRLIEAELERHAGLGPAPDARALLDVDARTRRSVREAAAK
ncbi:1-deoxy-D-xylulose 5-phosphate reductoisomerase [Humidesulfovibrio mexicanus]|uniref:1-deoxy-D-xylulose 5-phosphate reductoisomerase n=1 Tax=Humidesulfovibrio mexicanus TaxID=147047 RepID=A0A238Y0A2_9BACT|nr:1-deoxy-D-xylulose-5-phosphate reductoisomerase [Humidesulfovibrio mexicanus]SNR64736.1 1-deoxy-D-xylulose 5-phosphate reductoisomerase [Humidesulfovibrio mexicanus]